MSWEHLKPESASEPAERRTQAARRRDVRGGRRRTDWPEDAGISGCPRCGFAYPQIISVGRVEYRWACGECGNAFVTGRAARVAL